MYPTYIQCTPHVYIFKLTSSGTREKATQVSRSAEQTDAATVSCSKSCHPLPESGFSLNLLRGCRQEGSKTSVVDNVELEEVLKAILTEEKIVSSGDNKLGDLILP